MSRSASLVPEKQPRSAAESTKDSQQRFRVLLVDDEPNILKAITRVFRREGYQILTANSGREALDLLETEQFHLMLSDFRMPGMDGGELIKRAKARYPEMIRIMLTGHADTSSVMDAINEGAVYKFICKPWNDDDLRVTVALALQQFEHAARRVVGQGWFSHRCRHHSLSHGIRLRVVIRSPTHVPVPPITEDSSSHRQ